MSRASKPPRRAKAPPRRAPPASGDGPRLLAGGNPQIPKGDGEAPVQAYLEAMPGWKRDVGRELDARITKAVPEVKKAVRWNMPFYGVEGQGWFLGFRCFSNYLQISFLMGSELDPPPPKASKHAHVRYLDIKEGFDLDDGQLDAWIRQAAAHPGEALF